MDFVHLKIALTILAFIVLIVCRYQIKRVNKLIEKIDELLKK